MQEVTDSSNYLEMLGLERKALFSFYVAPGVYILPKNLIVLHVRILRILISFHVLTPRC